MEVEMPCGRIMLIDSDDWMWVRNIPWHASGRSERKYARHHIYYKGKGIGVLRLHRIIAGASRDQIVDHINGNTLDNRRCNLRIVSSQQNTMNAAGRKGTSRFKGVWFDRVSWRAEIRLNGKKYYLGRHKKEEGAALAYDKAARELFGEFARLNFPH